MRASTFLTALVVASSSAYTTFAVPVADAQRFSGATGNALGGTARPASDPNFHPLLRMNSGNGGTGGTTGSGNIGNVSGNREDGEGASTGASGATGDVNGGNAEGAAGLLELGSGNGGSGGGAKSGDVGLLGTSGTSRTASSQRVEEGCKECRSGLLGGALVPGLI